MRTLILTLLLCTTIADAAAPPTKKRHRNKEGKTPPQKTAKVPVPKGTPPTPGKPGHSDPRARLTKPADTPAGTPELTGREEEETIDPLDRPLVGNAEIQAGKSTAAGCEVKHSIETYVQISSASGPQASVEGGVFFVSDFRDVPQIYSLKTAGTWPTQVSFFPDGVAYYRVSPDGKKILAATHDGGDEQYQIHLIEPAKGEATGLLVDKSTRINSVAWGPDSKWFLYLSNARNKTDFDLYRYDLAEKKSTKLYDLVGSSSLEDVSLDGKSALLESYRSITDSDVLLVSTTPAEGSRPTVFADGDGKSRNRSPRFSADAKTVFLVSDQSSDLAQLYAVPVGDGAWKPLTAGKFEVDEFQLDRTRTSLLITTNEDGYTRWSGFVLDAAGRKGAALAVPKLDDGVVGSSSFLFGADRKSFFFTFSSSSQSSDVWLWKDGKRTQWTSSTQGGIRSECFSREKLVRYPSFDKREIPGFVYYPNGAQGPVPFIVYAHGGPESQYRPGFSRIFQYFLERGFGVFAPNVRGSTGYGREYTKLDNYQKRMDSVKDFVEAGKWLIENRYTRPGQVAIQGGSYGGFIVLRTIEVAPDLYSAAAESVGIANFVSFLTNTKPYRRLLREAEYGPLSDLEFLKSISPIHYVDQIKTPLLVFHGANDPRVPVGESEQIVEALKKRDVPAEAVIFKDEGHGNQKLRNIMEQARKTVYFFEKHIAKEKEKGS